MNLFQMSFYGSIIIISISIIRILTLNKLPKKTFIMLWCIALIRLLVPFTLPSSFSIYSVVNSPDFSTDTLEIHTLPIEIIRVEPTIANQTMDNYTSINISGIIWIIGMITLVAIFIITYIKCTREFRISLPIKNDYIEKWKMLHVTNRSINIRQSDQIKTPLTYGIFRPIILLPHNMNWDDEDTLNYVLTHEYFHIKHFDTAIKLIMIATLCIHWFNPFVWLMYILLNKDIELCCDESVVHNLGETTKSKYALILISMAEKRNNALPLCNNFSKNSIEERIISIMKTKKKSTIGIIAGIIVVIGIATIFATSEISNEDDYIKEAFSIEYSPLLALKSDGYEELSIAEFREKIIKTVDNKENSIMIDKAFGDEELISLRFQNEDASFLRNIVVGLGSKDWQDYYATGNVMKPFMHEQFERTAIIEFHFEYQLLSPETTKVEDLENLFNNISQDISRIFDDKSVDELRDQPDRQEECDNLAKILTEKYSTNGINISRLEMKYRGIGTTTTVTDNTNENEEIFSDYATQADYDKALDLFKIEGYEDMSLLEFRTHVTETSQKEFEDHEFNNFINSIHRSTVADNPEEINLTTDERDFLFYTLRYTIDENAVAFGQQYSEEPLETFTRQSFAVMYKDANGVQSPVTSHIDYKIVYTVEDESKLTVKKRDMALNAIIKGVYSDIMISENNSSTDDEITISIILTSKDIAEQYSDDIQLRVEELNFYRK